MTHRRLLACRCIVNTAVPIGQTLTCDLHGTVLVILPIYVVKCRDCLRLNGLLPDAPIAAMGDAARHSSRTRHTVDVWKRGELVHTAAPNPLQLTFDDIPPF